MRIYLECTATHQQDWHTGIQRVVRNLVNASRTIGPEVGVSCQPIVYDSRRGLVEIEGLPVRSGQSPANTASPRNTVRRVKTMLKHMGLLRVAQRADLVRRQTQDWLQTSLRRGSGQCLTVQSGDIILMLDGTWKSPYWADLETARSQGAKVGFVIHDVLPLTFPQFYPAHTIDVFRRWWLSACRSADFLLCSTQAVSKDVLTVLPSEARPQIEYFRLGMELDGAQTSSPIRESLQTLFTAESTTYLAVGTLSPRKNVSLLLDAFDQLPAHAADTKLVIVGGEGWDAEELVERIRSHQELGRRLFWFDDLHDGELDFCYRHATAMVTASNAEGFNLPIVEALSRTCPVIASDVPVHREVGGEWTCFFPANDSRSLARVLADRRTVDELRTRLVGYHWPDWQASCREMLQAVRGLEDKSAKAA